MITRFRSVRANRIDYGHRVGHLDGWFFVETRDGGTGGGEESLMRSTSRSQRGLKPTILLTFRRRDTLSFILGP